MLISYGVRPRNSPDFSYIPIAAFKRSYSINPTLDYEEKEAYWNLFIPLIKTPTSLRMQSMATSLPSHVLFMSLLRYLCFDRVSEIAGITLSIYSI